MADARTYGFELTGENIGGVFRTVTRFHCTRCPATLDIPYKTGNAMNSEGVAHAARRKGWDADGWSSNLTLCPACVLAKNNKPHDPDSELRKFEAKMKKQNGVVDAPTAPVVALRDMTADQRAKMEDADLLGGWTVIQWIRRSF